MPRVHIVKYGAYMDEDETANPDNEVDIMARIAKGLREQGSDDSDSPMLHGFVLEGSSPYGLGSMSQHSALEVATFSGMPVVRVGRADPGGRVPSGWDDVTIAGSNLDCNKARLLLMATMLKLGRLPKARDPRNPTRGRARWHRGQGGPVPGDIREPLAFLSCPIDEQAGQPQGASLADANGIWKPHVTSYPLLQKFWPASTDSIEEAGC